MSWKAHYSAAKSGPQLNNGSSVTPVALAYTPSTALGWQDHFKDLQAATSEVKSHIGSQLASAMTDDPKDQVALGGAIANAMSK